MALIDVDDLKSILLTKTSNFCKSVLWHLLPEKCVIHVPKLGNREDILVEPLLLPRFGVVGFNLVQFSHYLYAHENENKK